MAGNIVTVENKNVSHRSLDDSSLSKAEEWLDKGWRYGAQLVNGCSVQAEYWMDEMKNYASEFFGIPSTDKRVHQVVLPIYWSQLNKVWDCKTFVPIIKKKDNKPSWLTPKNPTLNGEMEPAYEKQYEDYILAVLET